MRRTTLRFLSFLILVAVATAGAARAQQCPGDCDGDDEVGINELVTSVNIALDRSSIASCAAIDSGFDGAVGINELIAAVSSAINGCPESRFRFLGFEQLNDELPDRIFEDSIEADVCREICTNQLEEPFSSTLVGVLIEAAPGATALLDSVEVSYPGLGIPSLRSVVRQPVSPTYCINIPGFPCETDSDCGPVDSCLPAPTSIAFTGLDLSRKELLAGPECLDSLEPSETPMLVRIRLSDDDESIDLVGGTTLISGNFDNCDS